MKTNGVKIKKIAVKSFISGFMGKTNCFVFWKKDLAVAVDSGGESEKISRFLKRSKLEVGAYWLTHGNATIIGREFVKNRVYCKAQKGQQL